MAAVLLRALAMDLNAEQLPPQVLKFKTYAKYRKALCEHFNLRFVRITGCGNCFFDSCAALLPAAGSGSDLRKEVIAFLAECIAGQHDLLGERCTREIKQELQQELVGPNHLYGAEAGAFPTPRSYLDASASNEVWVQGYHWIRAMAHLHSVCVCVVIHGFEHLQLFGVVAHPRIYLYKRDVDTHYDALVPQIQGISPAGDLESIAAARQHSLGVPLCMVYSTHHSLISAVYQLKAAAAHDNARRLGRRIAGFDSRAPIVVSDSEDVECALHDTASDLQMYSRFIDDLHRRCVSGVHKVVVQRVLRLQLQCTFASWIQLTPSQADTLYSQALHILRILSDFHKGCITDMEEAAAEYRDAGDDAAAEEMLQQLQLVLHPQYSSEDELEEVKCDQDSAAKKAAAIPAAEAPSPRRSLRARKKTKIIISSSSSSSISSSISSSSSSNSSSSSSSGDGGTAPRKRGVAATAAAGELCV
jgi:hypothetical protein